MKDIKEILSDDLKVAMLQKDTAAVNAIRTLRARIDNAEAPPMPELKSTQGTGGVAAVGSTEIDRKILTEQDIHEIVESEINDLESALAILHKHEKPDTQHLAEQIMILKKYLRI